MPKRNKAVDEHLSVLNALLDDQRNRQALASPVTKSYESGQYAGLSLALAEFRKRFKPYDAPIPIQHDQDTLSASPTLHPERLEKPYKGPYPPKLYTDGVEPLTKPGRIDKDLEYARGVINRGAKDIQRMRELSDGEKKLEEL